MSGSYRYDPSTGSTWSYARPPAARYSTSRTELWQIGLAFVVLTVDFSFVIYYIGGATVSDSPSLFGFPYFGVVIVALVASLTAFLLHEVAHKVVAQRLGHWAEFRLYWMGLALSLVTSIAIGWLFAAPGATLVSGMDYSERPGWGRTALAGPATNAGFGVVMFLLAFATLSLGAFVTSSLLFLAYINGWFGVFNLVPLGPLDGAKVFRWSKGYWAVAFALMAALAALGFFGWISGSPFLGLR
ncbi:MAG TPA: metalloprotease [Thermoplasmata archaeon]|nr:metalloprotease [Thermoplasmata archaeon]